MRRHKRGMLAEYTPAVLMLVDQAGELLEANALARQMITELPAAWGPYIRAGEPASTEYTHAGRAFRITFTPCLEGMHIYGVDITQQRMREEPLLERRRWLNHIIESLPNMLIFIDEYDAITAYFQPSGFPPLLAACEVPHPFRDLLSPDLLPMLEESIALVRAEQQPKGFIWHLEADDQEHWLDFQLGSVQNSDEILIVVADVTVRKRAEMELHKQRDFALQITRAMGQGVTVTDDNNVFEFVNPAFCDIVGRSEEELLATSPYQFTASEDFNVLRKALRHRSTGETSTYETRLLRPDGEERYVLVTGAPRYERGEVTGSIAVITDLTERIQMEQDLAAARDKAFEAVRVKSEFLAMMSHEIRTPMNSILGISELLEDTSLDEEQRELVGIIRSEANALLTIINDILYISRLEAGHVIIDAEPFNLIDEVSSTVDLIRAEACEKGISLVLDIDPAVPLAVEGDAVRVRQVLLNLLGNALKFTREGRITVLITAETPAHVRFSVIDTGIGIKPEQLDTLFDPFTQADSSTTRQYRGTGLGLSISKRLVQIMGGSIEVTSQWERGSAFTFELPFTIPSVTRVDGSDARGEIVMEDLTHLTVLVVEDNPANQELTLKQLEKLGYSTELACDGLQAVDLISAYPGRYDLILMDCHMPELDGFAATEAIRKMEQVTGHYTPIIALTANVLENIRQRCMQAGMSDYISKPVDLLTLQTMLRQWIQ